MFSATDILSRRPLRRRRHLELRRDGGEGTREGDEAVVDFSSFVVVPFIVAAICERGERGRI